MAMGGIAAGIYQTSLPDEIAGILNYLDVSVVFCNDQEQVDKVVEVRDQVPNVIRVIYEDPRGNAQLPLRRLVHGYRVALSPGRSGPLPVTVPSEIEARIDAGKPDDVCFYA